MLRRLLPAITRPLAFLSWIGLITVAAQSVVPPIPAGWHAPIMMVCAGVMAIHAAVVLWLDTLVDEPDAEGDDES